MDLDDVMYMASRMIIIKSPEAPGPEVKYKDSILILPLDVTSSR